jgi:hypothetical protein
MADLASLPEAFLYMKVGDHAGEGFDSILDRKRKELEQAGRTFWGYGGTACHPLMQVQPFVRSYVKTQRRIYLLMEPVNSKADPDVDPAEEFSADGATWQPIPAGIRVTGSRYALVLGDLQPVDLEIALDQYTVGVGPSRGKSAENYIQGRVDKGCLVHRPGPTSSMDTLLKKHLKLAAQLVDPYAVLLR